MSGVVLMFTRNKEPGMKNVWKGQLGQQNNNAFPNQTTSALLQIDSFLIVTTISSRQESLRSRSGWHHCWFWLHVWWYNTTTNHIHEQLPFQNKKLCRLSGSGRPPPHHQAIIHTLRHNFRCMSRNKDWEKNPAPFTKWLCPSGHVSFSVISGYWRMSNRRLLYMYQHWNIVRKKHRMRM